MKIPSVACLLYLLHNVLPAEGKVFCPYANENQGINIHEGQSVELPCPFNVDDKHLGELEVVWQMEQEGKNIQVVHHQIENDHTSEQSEEFRGRTFLGDDWSKRKNATVTLQRVSDKDTGMYTCWVRPSILTPADSHPCCKVYLTAVKPSKTEHLNSGALRSNYTANVFALLVILARVQQD